MPHSKDTLRATVPVYLVRHGITAWNDEGLVQGWTDIPLNDAGRAQAVRLGKALAGIRFGRVITSSLERARETAAAIAGHQGTPVEVFSELREYSCGEWEGRPYLEVRATEGERFWAWFNDPDVPMPGGESMTQASKRAVPIVRRVIEAMGEGPEEPLLIVAHGGINRLIAAHLLGMHLDTAKRLRLDNASVSIFEPFLGAYALKLWNSVAHLDGLPDSEEGSTASRVG
jgi:broad specificity phosphatase PhoE